MIRLETLNRLIRMFNAADTTGNRLSFGYVRLQAVGDHVRLDATDGVVLAEVSVLDANFANVLGKRPRYCHFDQLHALRRIAKEARFKVTAVAHVDSHGHVVIEDGESVTFDNSIDLPDFKQVKPTPRASDLVISIDAEKLLGLVRALQDGTSHSIVALTIQGPLKPITVTVDGSSGVLMPCRTTGGQS